MPENSLNLKQEQFCQEFIVDLNGTQAAIRAGYSQATASEQASRLLSNVKIQERIGELFQKRAAKLELSQEYVLKSLVKVLERCMEGKPVMEFDSDEKRWVPATDEDGNVIWTFNANGANRAAELLGKHLGMFTDKSDVSGDLLIKVLYERGERS